MTDRAQLAYQQWQQERPDLDPFSMQLIGHLGEVAQRIERDWQNPLFAQYGLRPGEFDVLATLRRAGEPYALTPTQLYEALLISSGGMTNRLDRLEQAQLVARHSNPNDRRGTLVALTPKGLALIDTLVTLHVENQRHYLSVLNSAEQQQLNALLTKLVQGLQQHSPL